jgi:hypothetical protein
LLQGFKVVHVICTNIRGQILLGGTFSKRGTSIPGV